MKIIKYVFVVLEYTDENETFVRSVFDNEKKALDYIKLCEDETGNFHDYFKKEVE